VITTVAAFAMHSLPVLHTLFIITWLGNVMKLRHMAVKPSNEHNQPEATRARAGNDSPQIPPPTGAPAIVVPMGFTNSTSHQALPTSLQARARSMTTCMCRACEAPGSAGSAWRMGSTAQPIAARLLYSAANGGPACQPSLAMLAVPRNTYNFHHSFTQARHDQPPIDTSMASSASARMHAMYTLVFTERRKRCRSAGCTASLGADREPAAPLARRLWRAPLTNHACSASHTRTSSSRAFARASLHHSVCCSAAALHLPPVQAVTASLCGGMWRTQRRLWLVGPGCSMPASPSCALCLQRALCPPQGVAAVKPRRHGTCLVRRQVRPPAISAVLLNTQLSVQCVTRFLPARRPPKLYPECAPAGSANTQVTAAAIAPLAADAAGPAAAGPTSSSPAAAPSAAVPSAGSGFPGSPASGPAPAVRLAAAADPPGVGAAPSPGSIRGLTTYAAPGVPAGAPAQLLSADPPGVGGVGAAPAPGFGRAFSAFYAASGTSVEPLQGFAAAGPPVRGPAAGR